MIGKIAPNGKGARGLANYLFRRGRGRIIAGTMAGLTPRELAREFAALRRLNPKLTKAVAHLMLSPAPGDPPLGDTQWQAIAEQYAEAMGYADAAWCGVLHDDTDHQHLHIIACRIDIHGKTISDANSYRKSEKVVRQLERDFGLVAVASPTGAKRRLAATSITTTQGEQTMHDTNPQSDTIRDTPATVVPSAQPGEVLSNEQDKAMRRGLVEPDYAAQMRAIFGDELTRVARHTGGNTLYFRSPWHVYDSGHTLRVMNYKPSEAAQAAASIVRMAVNPPKCWKSITFTGTDEFVTCAMREARDYGLEIIAVGDAQLEILARVMAEGRGDGGSMAAMAAAPTPGVDAILAPLRELDNLPPPVPKLPVFEIFYKPMAPAPASQPEPKPVVGAPPAIPNLRERLQARRKNLAPKPSEPAPVAPKRPGLPGA